MFIVRFFTFGLFFVTSFAQAFNLFQNRILPFLILYFVSIFFLFLIFVRYFYFPKQNLEKISFNISSVTFSPVILAKFSNISLIEIATISNGIWLFIAS